MNVNSRQILAVSDCTRSCSSSQVLVGCDCFISFFQQTKAWCLKSRWALCIQQPTVVSESLGQGQRTEIADFPFIWGSLAVPAFGETLPRFEKQVMWLEWLVGMNSTTNFGTEPIESISRNLVCLTIQTKKKPSRISTRTPRTSRCEVRLVAVFETFLRKP